MTTTTRPRSGRRPRRLIAAALGLSLLAAGCGLSDGPDRGRAVALDSVAPVASLQAFDSCAGLLDHLRAEALERVGPYGLDEAVPYLPMEGLIEEDAVAAPVEREAAGGDVAATPDPDVSGTNVQEPGVDEPDLVKADGQRMVVVTDDELVVIDLTGTEPVVAGRLGLTSGFDHELLVVDDRALVLTRDGDGVEPRFDDTADLSVMPSTSLTEIDLSNPSAPTVVRTVDVAGSYVSARMQGSVARVVVTSSGPDLGFVYPAEATDAGERRAEAVNRSIVEQSTLEDWLPAWSARADNGTGENSGWFDDCDAIHRPADYAGFGLVSVLSVDLRTGLGDLAPVSVLGAGETVYAAADSLYVATERFAEPTEADGDEPTAAPLDEEIVDIAPPAPDIRTTIHRFSAPAEGPVDYEASGEVEGRLLNQFSLSEHDDVLRVASTRGEPWFDGGSDSIVTTLGLDGDRLVELGRVEDLGRGEEIFAVRFVGPVGYVVTFRQTDPLYVVDLADPASPTVDGELKILGYSAYLHAIDETHVLGVGQDADEEGRTLGTQVSLFDVSNPAAPVRTAQVTVPGGNSEVEWDHRAFLWWAPDGVAVVPVEQYEEEYGTGALVIDVDAASGTLAQRGRIDHSSSPVRRSVVIDDTLVTMDRSSLVFSSLGDLGRQADITL